MKQYSEVIRTAVQQGIANIYGADTAHALRLVINNHHMEISQDPHFLDEYGYRLNGCRWWRRFIKVDDLRSTTDMFPKCPFCGVTMTMKIKWAMQTKNENTFINEYKCLICNYSIEDKSTMGNKEK